MRVGVRLSESADSESPDSESDSESESESPDSRDHSWGTFRPTLALRSTVTAVGLRLPSLMSTEQFTISSRSRVEHAVEVSSPGIICWSLSVGKSQTLDVEVLWRGSGSSSLTVVPRMRLGPEERDVTFSATSAGTLTFSFENDALFGSRAATLTLSKASSALGPTAGLSVEADAAALNYLALEGVRLFFKNKFEEAEAIFATERLRVPVYAISYATLSWLKALMTWEPTAIAETKRRLEAAQAIAGAYMPSDTLAAAVAASARAAVGAALSGVGADSLAASATGAATGASPVALEATLIYAEAQLLSALLALMEESMLSLARCALNIRSGWRLYGVVDKALGGKVMSIVSSAPLGDGARLEFVDGVAARGGEASAANETRADVVGGLLFGVGGFNSVASLLPPIILRILSAVGLPFSRAAGLAQLRDCLLGGRVRAPLSGLLLCGMRVIVPSFHTGALLAHAPEAEATLRILLTAFPDSALPLWMSGRLLRMQGKLSAAAAAFSASGASAGGALAQLESLSAYERAWCEAFSGDWETTAELFAQLRDSNNWSKAFYAYGVAVAMLQLGRLGEARAAMSDVLTLSSRRLGGRVIPAEQYAVKRAVEYLAFTLPPLGSVVSDVPPSSTAPSLSPPAGITRVRIPAFVAPGSPAHAAALAYPTMLPGLELIYFFGGFSQMGGCALAESLRTADASLDAVSRGQAFDAAADVWRAGDAGEGATAEAPFDAARAGTAFKVGRLAEGDASDAASAASLNADAVRALLTRTSSVSSAGLLSRSEEAALSARGGGLFSSTFSSLRAAVSGVTSAVADSAGAALRVVAGGSGESGSASLPAPPIPKPLAATPATAAAVGALLRGALCGVLGRADEATAALTWLRSATDGERRPLFSPREIGTIAYGAYEEGLLALDVLLARSATSPPDATAVARASTRERHTLADGVILKTAFAARFANAAAAAAATADALKRARGVREDFPWRVRLHIRGHLANDEMRVALTGRESSPPGPADGAAEDSDEEVIAGLDGLDAAADAQAS